MGQGPGPERVCLKPACSMWVLDFVQEKFTTRVEVVVRVCYLKLGTVKEGRA